MTRTEHFDTPEPVELFVRNAAGSIEVGTTDDGSTTVELVGDDGSDRVEKARVDASDGGRRIVVDLPDRKGLTGLGRQHRVAVRVAVPAGSRLRLNAASADIAAAGRFGEAEAHTASGNIRLGEVAGPVKAHAASGNVRVDAAGGGSVHTASGNISVGRTTAERLEVHAASGDVTLGLVEASVKVRTASGRLTIDEAVSGFLDLHTASGDQRIGVRRGVTAKLDVSSNGRVRSELPVEDAAPAEGAPLEIHSRAASGTVVIRSATP